MRVLIAGAGTFVLAVAAMVVSVAGVGAQSPHEGAHPQGTRTGIAAVDAVLEAVENDAALGGLLEGVPTECAAEPLLGGAYCPEGTPDGTVIEAVFSGGCELSGRDISDPAVLADLEAALSGDFALYGVSAASAAGLGEYRVYLTSGTGAPQEWRRLSVGERGIVAFSSGCGETVSDAFASDGNVVFAPAEGGAEPTATPAAPQTGSGQGDAEGSESASSAAVVGVVVAGVAGAAAVGMRGRRTA